MVTSSSSSWMWRCLATWSSSGESPPSTKVSSLVKVNPSSNHLSKTRQTRIFVCASIPRRVISLTIFLAAQKSCMWMEIKRMPLSTNLTSFPRKAKWFVKCFSLSNQPS